MGKTGSFSGGQRKALLSKALIQLSLLVVWSEATQPWGLR